MVRRSWCCEACSCFTTCGCFLVVRGCCVDKTASTTRLSGVVNRKMEHERCLLWCFLSNSSKLSLFLSRPCRSLVPLILCLSRSWGRLTFFCLSASFHDRHGGATGHEQGTQHGWVVQHSQRSDGRLYRKVRDGTTDGRPDNATLGSPYNSAWSFSVIHVEHAGVFRAVVCSTVDLVHHVRHGGGGPSKFLSSSQKSKSEQGRGT